MVACLPVTLALRCEWYCCGEYHARSILQH